VFDIKWIRDNVEAFDAGLKKRDLAPLSEKLLEIDDARRQHLTKLQDVQARRNAASKEIGKAKAAKDEVAAQKLMAEVAELKEVIQQGEEEERQIDARLRDEMSGIPNIPLDDVPLGKDEHDNKEVRKVGEPTTFDFKPKQHFEIGETLGLMDFETAAKISGARFVILKGALARLERALAMFMLDLHTAPVKDGLGGYSECVVPLLVRTESAYGTGNLPKFAEDLFATSKLLGPEERIQEANERLHAQLVPSNLMTKPWHERVSYIEANYGVEEILKVVGDEFARVPLERLLWLIPTGEIPLTNTVRESTLDEAQLPLRLTAHTPCFRSEAGAAGRDTRGMIRQHQFSKVELVSITTPDESLAEHERMTSCAEEVLKRLGLPFRTMLLCTGDMGFASRKTYDIEVWLPGEDTYREISSCSVCGDFQARRMNARFRPKGSKELQFVHTLNGSGLAVGRTLIAVLENYQQADGSVTIPKALVPYMGGLTKIEKAG